MVKEADGYIRAGPQIDALWLRALVEAGIINLEVSEHLTSKRYSLLKIRPEDLAFPMELMAEFVEVVSRVVLEYGVTRSPAG